MITEVWGLSNLSRTTQLVSGGAETEAWAVWLQALGSGILTVLLPSGSGIVSRCSMGPPTPLPGGGLFLLLVAHVPLRTGFPCSTWGPVPCVQARPFETEGMRGNSPAKLLLHARHLTHVHVLSVPQEFCGVGCKIPLLQIRILRHRGVK